MYINKHNVTEVVTNPPREEKRFRYYLLYKIYIDLTLNY